MIRLMTPEHHPLEGYDNSSCEHSSFPALAVGIAAGGFTTTSKARQFDASSVLVYVIDNTTLAYPLQVRITNPEVLMACGCSLSGTRTAAVDLGHPASSFPQPSGGRVC